VFDRDTRDRVVRLARRRRAASRARAERGVVRVADLRTTERERLRRRSARGNDDEIRSSSTAIEGVVADRLPAFAVARESIAARDVRGQARGAPLLRRLP